MKDKMAIYIFCYGFNHDENRPIAAERMKYINSDTESYGDEKYFGWRLLQIAFDETFGVNVDNLNPRQLETGKWIIDNYYFSISDSGKYVMVGVSTKPLGVDVQKIREVPYDHFVNREMCPEEIEYYLGKKPWEHYYEHVEKESIYKCYGKGPIEWKKINTLKYKDRLHSGEFGDYLYSICSELFIDKDFKFKIQCNFNIDDPLFITKHSTIYGKYD